MCGSVAGLFAMRGLLLIGRTPGSRNPCDRSGRISAAVARKEGFQMASGSLAEAKHGCLEPRMTNYDWASM